MLIDVLSQTDGQLKNMYKSWQEQILIEIKTLIKRVSNLPKTTKKNEKTSLILSYKSNLFPQSGDHCEPVQCV